MTTIPSDPLFSSQLHLRNTTAGQFDINVVDVWDDYTGNGIIITVIDTRVDRFHPDYDANYDITFDWDYIDNDTAPDALGSESQGTATTGIIAAEEGNGIGGVGVAWDSTVRNFGGLDFEYLDDQLLDAAGQGDTTGNPTGNANGSDVVLVNSQVSVGSPVNQLFNNDLNYDPTTGNLADLQATEAALATGSANGRGGLGTIYVKSAGDSRAVVDSEFRGETTAEQIASSKYTIVVGATRWDGWVNDTSTPGASLLVSAPTDDTSDNWQVVTTDRQGSAGFNTTAGAAGDYTDTSGSYFGGTAAAASQVSGVVALMLDANPDLGWRDVQEILAYSARHVGSAVGAVANTGAPATGGNEQVTQTNGATWFWNGADNWNGGGLHFSNDYGYGLVDAKAAVRLAETWRDQSTSANDVTASQDVDGTNITTTYSTSFTTFTTTETTNISIEHVYLNVDISVLDDMTDMEIFVTSPGGTRVQMIADTGGAQGIAVDNTGFTAGGGFDWTFGSTAFWGEESAGDWTVQIRDDDGSASGTFTTTDVDLFFHGSAVTTNDTFIFTNEFGDYAGVGGHVTAFSGGGSFNVLNAAAVDSGSIINLLSNTGTIDGVAITASAINAVYTGDGNDSITGDSLSTELYSGRGDDEIDINTTIGSKIYDGGTGTDTVDWSGSSESGATFDLVAETATDAAANVDAMRGFENLNGTNNADTIVGTSGTNTIHGNGGDDWIDGGDGLDLLYGDGGTDTIDYSAYTFGGIFVNTIDLVAGTMTEFLSVETIEGFENVEGSQGTEAIFGTSAANVINGNDGDDFISGRGGQDTIDGGAGNDTVYWESNPSLLARTISGGADTDTINGGGNNFGSVAVFDLTAGTFDSGLGYTETWADFENYDNSTSTGGAESVTGTSGANTILTGGGANTVIAGSGEDMIDTGAGEDTIDGGDNNDTIHAGANDDAVDGGTGDDTIYGDGGNDTLLGGIGFDTIIGGLGGDAIDGGTGNDTASYAGSSAGVNVQLQYHVATGGDANGDTLTSIERLTGSDHDDTLYGDPGANIIRGGDGSDHIKGLAGADNLYGDLGDDWLYVDSFDNAALGGGGIDRLIVVGTGGVTNAVG
ncbi:MAG: proprotein convertase P-domain-containing protein, partial [Rhodobiaceae bacterium]|nr:proprotein convertase P-domain-containing protein [Rhodobiaceae bacterium]